MEPLDVPQVSVTETAEQLNAGTIVLLDVREPHEWHAGHVDGAIHVPLGELTVGSVPADKPVVVMCHLGGRSQSASQALRDAGVDARNMAGGIVAWEAADLPIE